MKCFAASCSLRMYTELHILRSSMTHRDTCHTHIYLDAARERTTAETRHKNNGIIKTIDFSILHISFDKPGSQCISLSSSAEASLLLSAFIIILTLVVKARNSVHSFKHRVENNSICQDLERSLLWAGFL